MDRVVNAVEIPCWIAVVILAIIAGTFNFTLAAIAGIILVGAAILIWSLVHRDVLSIKVDRDENGVPKK